MMNDEKIKKNQQDVSNIVDVLKKAADNSFKVIESIVFVSDAIKCAKKDELEDAIKNFAKCLVDYINCNREVTILRINNTYKQLVNHVNKNSLVILEDFMDDIKENGTPGDLIKSLNKIIQKYLENYDKVLYKDTGDTVGLFKNKQKLN